jgi:phospholipase C
MSEITRRRLLGTGAAAAGGAVVSSLLPPGIRQALAAGPRAGSLKDIEHVVIHMQENRSFDHYFGTLAGVRGFADPHALTLSTGRSVFHQPDHSNPDQAGLPPAAGTGGRWAVGGRRPGYYQCTPRVAWANARCSASRRRSDEPPPSGNSL